MSPNLKKVENVAKNNLKILRKPYKLSVEDFFKNPKTASILFSKLIGSDKVNQSFIIPSCSYGIANVVSNLPKKKGNIIIAENQFPSNVYPWMASNYNVKIIKPPHNVKNRVESWNNAIINAIDENTAALCLEHIHWADGSIFDLKSIIEKVKKYDAYTIIDGTQSIGSYPFSIKEYNVDALICAGYKTLFGPYSIGMAYFNEKFNNGIPIEHNFINRHNSHIFSELTNYETEYRPGALRYGVGQQSNFILLPMLIEAMKQVLKWGAENIQQYCQSLVSESVNQLIDMGYIIENKNYRASHLFGIRLPKNKNLDQINKNLKMNRVVVSTRGDVIRVSPNVYNNKKDLKKLVKSFL